MPFYREYRERGFEIVALMFERHGEFAKAAGAVRGYRSGAVRSIHTGFAGPATGRHHDEYVREFREEVDRLLAEDAR